jgi:hypothetical protein
MEVSNRSYAQYESKASTIRNTLARVFLSYLFSTVERGRYRHVTFGLASLLCAVLVLGIGTPLYHNSTFQDSRK